MTSGRWWGRTVLLILRHPTLWVTALRQLARLAAPGWWRRPPFLPVPSADYLRFRLETQYGSDHDPEPEDILTYLRWCRAFPGDG